MKILKRLFQIIGMLLLLVVFVLGVILGFILLIPYFIITGRVIYADLIKLLDRIPDNIASFLNLD